MSTRGFHFLKLPGEVRNTIYRLLLVRDRYVQMPCKPDDMPVQVFRLSRQVFEETIPIFYGENTFHIACGCLLKFWDCPLRYQHYVRKIRHEPHTYHTFWDLDSRVGRQLKMFPSLKKLELHFFNCHYGKEAIMVAHQRVKLWLRSGRSIIGRALTTMPSVDIWIIERQLDRTGYRRINGVWSDLHEDYNDDGPLLLAMDKKRTIISQAIIDPARPGSSNVMLVPEVM